MKENEIHEIIQCLSRDRIRFYYYKNRYAAMLLKYYVGGGRRIQEIKNSKFGRLLKKPNLKDVLKNAGDGVLSDGALEANWPMAYECYLLTLGIWGERSRWARYYTQTSRPGVNLVLQLNFTARHNRTYEKLIQPRGKHPFKCGAHPVAEGGYHTLAWARIDMDFRTDEALIEEIQSDWIPMAMDGSATVAALEASKTERRRVIVQRCLDRYDCNYKAFNAYVVDVLKPHMSIWDEAMLTATIWFLREEIGIRRIYYHTHDSGSKLKNIYGGNPPRSIYTRLPQRFCFSETNNMPKFLLNERNRRLRSLIKSRAIRFYRLDL